LFIKEIKNYQFEREDVRQGAAEQVCEVAGMGDVH